MPENKNKVSTQEADLLRELKENVQQNKAIFREILKLTNDIIVLLDRDGIILEASEHVERSFGIPLHNIIGKLSWEHFVFEEDRDRIRGYFQDRAEGIGDPPSTYTLRLNVPGEESHFMRANVGFIPGTENRIVILKDLSEVVQEQRKTAQTEERYRTVVENTQDGILICTEERVLFTNSSFCRMAEFSREEIYTFSPESLFHSKSRDKLKMVFLKSEQKEPLIFEALIKKRIGYLPVEISSTPMIYRNTEAVLISIRDIAQRKETESKLKENHKLLKAIVDNSPVGISVHDRHGTLLMANASWRAIWNKSIEDLKDNMKPRTELRMNEKDNYLGENIRDVERVYRQGGELFIPKIKISNPSPGGAEYISHHFYALMDDRDEVDMVVILTLDLTESLKTKIELEETRDLYRELSGNIPVAIYRTTLQSGGRIISANPEMYRMFREEESEHFEGISVEDLYVDPERRKELKEKLLEKKEVRSFEAELNRIDGSSFLASISARMIVKKNGGEKYIEGIIRDITDERRMEEELQNIEHLESIGTLAGGIAHDFNNLLMTIQGNISLAHIEKDPAKLRKHLEEAEASVEKATILASQLLTFSRGGNPLKEVIDVPTFIRESVQFALRGSDVEAVFSFDDNLKQMEADSEQIAQVIQNVCLNSVQAIEGSGRLTVSCSNVELKSDAHVESGEYIRLSIKDTGQGISPDDLKKIFNPYFTTKPDGSGLGLSTSYSIVSRHSGTIKVYSEEGKGTEFVIYLPTAGKETRPLDEEKVPDDEVPAISARILIMDDDPKVRNVLSSMLEILGYSVTESSEGSEAIELYRDGIAAGKPFDAVIMDLTVPGGMGGEAAIEKLKQIDPDVRAIVSSGYANNQVLSSFTDYGFGGRLTKPFRLSTLKKELYAVLTRK